MQIDFCSVIDNALLRAAREESQRRNRGQPVMIQPKPGHGRVRPERARPPKAGGRLTSVTLPRSGRIAHAAQ